MSDLLPFDKHIQNQLGGYSPDVPPHIWDQIVAQRKRQRPKGFWLRFFTGRNLLLLGTLLLAIGGTAYWLSRPTAPAAAPVAAQITDATQTTAAHTIPSNQANPTHLPAPNSKQQHTDAPQLATATDGTDNNTASNNNRIVHNNMASTTGADRSGNPSALNTTIAANDKAKLTMGNKTGSDGLHFVPSANNRFVKRKGKPLRLAVGNTFNKSMTDKDGGQNDKAAIDNIVANDNPTSANNADGSATAKLPKLGGAATGIYGNQAPMGQLRNKPLYNLTLPDCPTIEDNAAANKKYVELYLGPDFGLRSFGSFNSDTNSINYLQKRKESARFASAFSAGLRYTKVFSNGMSLRSGINYSQINEKFQYINERDIRYILIVTPRQIISGGNTITVFDTLRYTETGKRIKTTYNRYRHIDIPLQLGYEFGNGRLHTNISAGAIINLYSWQKGEVLDANYQPVSITTGKSSSAYGFKTNIGVGFLGSLSVYYKLTPRLHALAEPYFRYNLQPMTRENQNITQKYSLVGLRLGLRWDFK